MFDLKKNRQRKNLMAMLLLVVFSAGSRVLLHQLRIAINVEFVTVSTLLAAVYLGSPWHVLAPVLSMAVSDLVIGNTSIFIFTWSAYAIIGLVGRSHAMISLLISRWTKSSTQASRVFAATAFGVFSSIFFYLWTNFGVWFQGWYPSTLQGLITCYLMGLPFLKYNLLGNLVFVSLGFGIVELMIAFFPGIRFFLSLEQTDE